MKRLAVFLIIGLITGCRQDDPRLIGTWRSNREATVAAHFARDPRWTNASPERIAQYREMFGHMTVTWSKGKATYTMRGETESFRYRVVDKGSDFVIIHTAGYDIRIRFENSAAYWITSIIGTEERFDKLVGQ